MNIIKTFKLIKASLSKEDECVLSYFFGTQLDNIDSFKRLKSNYPGVILQICLYFYTLFKSVRLGKDNLSRTKEVLVFAATKNQYNSLNSTLNGLNKLGIGYNLITSEVVDDKSSHFSISVLDFLISLCTCILNSPKLYFKLKKANKNFEKKYFFSALCQSYTFLPYFIRTLYRLSSNGSLKLVVMSNDHNSANRCLRLVCEMLKIKTLYMQHASVSKLFPPLQFDYALLDGEIAHETYKSCAGNLPGISTLPVNIFLSGQKKIINIKKERAVDFDIGIAVNMLDKFDYLKVLIEKLKGSGKRVLIRTHPSQPTSFLEELRLILTENQVQWCDPRKDSLRSFFTSINCLISANSSIHLEAALAGKATLYYEFSSDAEISDYYGYLKNGLVYALNIDNIEQSINEGVTYCSGAERSKAVKKYSATYMTKWENKEGDLSARLIGNILKERSFEDFFELSESNYHTLYELK
ncbi:MULTISPECIES: hypothetical protein [unclassified Pseudoalteromonas]|uniref:hypothetical protein n=1 Tax=unclassified Pseudoalteromonas TaxID=194690 RepID=UPI0003F90343|nr:MULTISPECIES: hypothetical protein [unclassified Pseudoalteromonas]MBB1380298.1 hypothetical protein [Pseudoalteromonas sp. SR43-2]